MGKTLMATEAKPTKVRPHIRWMIRRDMPEVLSIERGSFANPWTDKDFLRCLRTRNCIGMVAELGEAVHGYMVYELHKERLHLLNLAVHPCSLRCGIGSAMVNKLVGKLTPLRRHTILCEVRESNLRAQLFMRTCGLRATSTLRNFYEDFYTTEDAYLFEYRVPECAGK